MKTFKYEKPSLIMGQWCLFETPWLIEMYLILLKGWKRKTHRYIYGYTESYIVHESKAPDHFKKWKERVRNSY